MLRSPAVRPPRQCLLCVVVVLDDVVDVPGVNRTLLVLGNGGNHLFERSRELGIDVARDAFSNSSTCDLGGSWG